jgi:hypothetical protein
MIDYFIKLKCNITRLVCSCNHSIYDIHFPPSWWELGFEVTYSVPQQVMAAKSKTMFEIRFSEVRFCKAHLFLGQNAPKPNILHRIVLYH